MRIGNSQKRVKLPHNVIVKAPSLLPMLYKVSELAHELGLADRTLRDWLNRGAPFQRDTRNRIWILGTEFTSWVESNKKNKKRNTLKNDEAYCLRCKRIVKLIDPEIKIVKGKLIHFKGTCEWCGCKINRGGRIG